MSLRRYINIVVHVFNCSVKLDQSAFRNRKQQCKQNIDKYKTHFVAVAKFFLHKKRHRESIIIDSQLQICNG